MKEQLDIAVEIAIKAHRSQMYGNLPYIYHLYEVDHLVVGMYAPETKNGEPYCKEPGDEIDNLRAIAYLHDVLEDTEVKSVDLLSAGVNRAVVDAVEAITKIEGVPYLSYIDVVCSNELARKVKLCDTSANLMNSIKEGNAKRINKYSKQLQLLGGF